MKLEGGGVARQRVVYLVPDPITVEAMPPVGNELRLRVKEPTGKGFTGRLALTDASGVAAAASGLLSMIAGETEKTVVVPLAGVAGREWSFGVKLYDEKVTEGAVVTLPRRTYRLVQAKYKVRADGDGKVKSSEVLDSAAPPETAPVGGAVVRLKYEMEPGWKFEQVMPATEEGRRIEGKPSSVGMWVYGDGSGCQIRARFMDAQGQTFQPDGPRVDWKGWRWVTLPMRGGTIHHWGKGDGEIHYPIRWDTALLLDNVSKQKVNGEIWVGSVMTVE
jgi:hypothetical protein